MTGYVNLAKLDEEQLKRVEQMEEQLGVNVLAYTQPIVPADLTEEQLAKLEALEAELGLCLVAYGKQ